MGVLGCPGPESCVHGPLWLVDLLPGDLTHPCLLPGPDGLPSPLPSSPPSHFHRNNWGRIFWGSTQSAKFESGISLGTWVPSNLEIELVKRVPEGLNCWEQFGNRLSWLLQTMRLRDVSSPPDPACHAPGTPGRECSSRTWGVDGLQGSRSCIQSQGKGTGVHPECLLVQGTE